MQYPVNSVKQIYQCYTGTTVMPNDETTKMVVEAYAARQIWLETNRVPFLPVDTLTCSEWWATL